MGRIKHSRKINFKPLYKKFAPTDKGTTGTTHLLDEEMEALYLMDILELYQEEAAKKMEISRPTFTRILKNARVKLTTALVSGHSINIEDHRDFTIVAICGDDETFKNIQNNRKFIFIYSVSKEDTTLVNKILNPISSSEDKPATILPQILIENNVDLFISCKIGEGIKNTLISKGIEPLVKEKIELKELAYLL
ncbi:MAG: DUF134 domain-containing protein [Sulfurimonas sp.]|jgi:predicted DNA-binding protein (UPF0251 family)/predicted Fe-Mo cluster-binding NifX family protein|nr:DUF134 domain-containing protein [Sulfurimonas sp.]